MFEKLTWQQDRALLGDVVFRLYYQLDPSWELGGECLVLFKDRKVLKEYERFWSSRPEFLPESFLELGMWDGGSVVLWFELLQPQKHVAIDLQQREDSEYLRKYVAQRDLESRLKTYWGTDQADLGRLRQIVDAEFSGPLDLVIDDASHLYAQTKASFSLLFPRLRPGGFYIIEDWNWAHWPQHFGLDRVPLTRLVHELVEAAGTSAELISEIVVYNGFVAVQRGVMDLPDDLLDLEKHIRRRPRFWPLRQAASRVKQSVRGAVSRLLGR